jgi:hypothetical protein
MTDNAIKKTFPLSGPINLNVRIAHGSVTVETEDGLAEAAVQIEADKDAVDLLEQTTVELRGGALAVVAPRQGGIFDLPVFGPWRSKRSGLHVAVRVPSGTPVRISTFTAPIRVLGRVGSADLASGAAEIAARHVDGDLRLRYGSGNAQVVQVAGAVQLRSGSGDSKFGEVGGDLVAGCGSGNLRVRVAHGAVRSRCGSGNARLEEVHGDVDVASGSGGLDVGLPAGVTARLDVHTGAGQVRSELPIEDAPRSGATTIRLRARTGSGDVRLFRAA